MKATPAFPRSSPFKGSDTEHDNFAVLLHAERGFEQVKKFRTITLAVALTTALSFGATGAAAAGMRGTGTTGTMGTGTTTTSGYTGSNYDATAGTWNYYHYRKYGTTGPLVPTQGAVLAQVPILGQERVLVLWVKSIVMATI